jgi:hypothetical protein
VDQPQLLGERRIGKSHVLGTPVAAFTALSLRMGSKNGLNNGKPRNRGG